MSTKLFSAIRLGQVDLDNRIVVSPMCQYSANDGCASDWHSTHLGMLANSGAALVVIEMTDIERHGRITHGCLGLYSDDCEAALGRVVAHCRHIGTARLGIQIAHAGRKGSAHPPWEGGGPLGPDEDPWETIAPSPLSFGPKWPVPREMAEPDFARVREAFVQAVRRAVRIGFDTIELHMAHGYLLHSFLSPVANQRRDQYGGSLEGRIRFPLQVARAVREVVPSGRALGARITGSDWHADGIAIDDAVAFATALKEAGFDYLDVSSGGITAETRNPTQPGYNAPLAQRVRDQVKLPTRTVGLISTPQQADALVGKGQADMVALGRAMLDNPHWGWHAARMLGAEVKRPKQYQRAGPKLWSPAVALD